jgi:hypothetical protein
MMSAIDSIYDGAVNGDKQTWLFLIAIYCLLCGLISLIVQIRILNWAATSGKLIQSKVANWGSASSVSEVHYNANVKYNYTVAGTVYEGHRLSPWTAIVSTNLRFILRWQMKGITYLSPDKVAVFYKPTNPKKSYLIKPGKIGFGFTVAVIFFPMVYLLFGGSSFLL